MRWTPPENINTMRPSKYRRHFADNLFSLDENVRILSKRSPKYVPHVVSGCFGPKLMDYSMSVKITGSL